MHDLSHSIDDRGFGHLRAAAVSGSTPGLFSITRKEGASPPPSSASLIHRIIESGLSAVRPDIERARTLFPDRALVDEAELNWLGYHFLLWWGREAEALEVFQLNTELNPASANAFYELGEGYRMLGRKEDAIAAYRRSLELNPKNANAAAALEGLTKK